jgi:predicted RNase H-like HicB family nuclease
MNTRGILSTYIEQALAQAQYDKLEDGTFAGRIPACKGVIAFGSTLVECEEQLRSTLEDWILVGIKLGHPLPVIAGLDLNKEPTREPVDAV